MDSNKPASGSLIPAIVSLVFVVFAMMFGMGEWKHAPAIASVPPTVTQH
jgi:hypothetical protein